MKYSIPYILLLFHFLFLTKPRSDAQTPDELLALAVAENQQLKVLKKMYQAALEQAPQVSQLPHPEIGMGVFILPVETRLGPQRARLSLTQRFPWFGTLKAQENQALAHAKAQFERIAATELELRYRISQAYFSLYELQTSQVIIQRNIILLESWKLLTETKVANGQTTLADVLRIDLKLDELAQKIKILENRKRKPLAQINQILNRDPFEAIILPDSLSFAQLNLEKDSLWRHLQASHPLIRMYEHQQQSAEAAIQANRLQGKPSLGLGADYLYTEQRNDASPTNNGRDAFQLRATLSLPLYRKKYQAKARAEQFRIEALEAEKQENLSQFKAQMEQAYADLAEAQLDRELYTRQIQTTQSAIHILVADYTGNSRRFDELLQLEMTLIDYELGQLQAVVKSHIARAGIERYLPFNN